MYSLLVIDDMKSATPYTVLGNDTDNLATSTTRLTGATSLEFDKVDGAANKAYAGAARTDLNINLTENGMNIHDMVSFAIYISDLTNVASAYVKLGSSATNNLEFQVADSALAAAWKLCNVTVGDGTLNGTGWDPSAITYLEVGVNFDAVGNTLADMKVDSVMITSANYTRT
jgi:hypothetical protein